MKGEKWMVSFPSYFWNSLEGLEIVNPLTPILRKWTAPASLHVRDKHDYPRENWMPSQKITCEGLLWKLYFSNYLLLEKWQWGWIKMAGWKWLIKQTNLKILKLRDFISLFFLWRLEKVTKKTPLRSRVGALTVFSLETALLCSSSPRFLLNQFRVHNNVGASAFS